MILNTPNPSRLDNYSQAIKILKTFLLKRSKFWQELLSTFEFAVTWLSNLLFFIVFGNS